MGEDTAPPAVAAEAGGAGETGGAGGDEGGSAWRGFEKTWGPGSEASLGLPSVRQVVHSMEAWLARSHHWIDTTSFQGGDGSASLPPLLCLLLHCWPGRWDQGGGSIWG